MKDGCRKEMNYINLENNIAGKTERREDYFDF
jgi:hypothetical protein